MLSGLRFRIYGLGVRVYDSPVSMTSLAIFFFFFLFFGPEIDLSTVEVVSSTSASKVNSAATSAMTTSAVTTFSARPSAVTTLDRSEGFRISCFRA